MPLRPTPVADTYLQKIVEEAQDLYPLDLIFADTVGMCSYWILWIRNYCSGNISILPRLLCAVEHFRKYVAEVTRRYPSQNKGLVVDIGSNDGTALRFLK